MILQQKMIVYIYFSVFLSYITYPSFQGWKNCNSSSNRPKDNSFPLLKFSKIEDLGNQYYKILPFHPPQDILERSKNFHFLFTRSNHLLVETTKFSIELENLLGLSTGTMTRNKVRNEEQEEEAKKNEERERERAREGGERRPPLTARRITG